MDPIKQAEAELRAAALAYVEANKAYADAYDRNGDFEQYVKDPKRPLHPETKAKVQISNARMDALAEAAKALAAALADQQPAQPRAEGV